MSPFSRAREATSPVVGGGGEGGEEISGAELAGLEVEAGGQEALEVDETSDDGLGAPEEVSPETPQTLLYSTYKIKHGDILGRIANDKALKQSTLISVNKIVNTRALRDYGPQSILRIPNQDGILHTVARGESLSSIAEKYKEYNVTVSAIRTVNELFSDTIQPGEELFIPGAELDGLKLQEINGDVFLWPVASHRITSRFGMRISPITGRRSFHTGIDIGAPSGTPIRSAMPGRVTYAGYNRVLGNHVMIKHHSGYATVYGHMSKIKTRVGSYVAQGQVIGLVGSTGESTGPHLHYTVYKNGKMVNPQLLTH
jgi:murein DD-endopeptidase MepM/ murein hydrolase activator NlpD